VHDDMLAFIRTSDAAMDGAVQRVARPEPGPGEVRITVASCGICGSDLHALRGDPGFEWVRPPVTMGHEFGGTVVQLGQDVETLEVGQRVVATSIQGCLTCAVCRAGTTQLCPQRRIIGLSYDGGLAEEVVVGAPHLVPVPDQVPIEHAAIAEPLSVAVRAVLAQPLIAPGDRVVVSGPGPIGLFCARLAALCGAEVCVVGGRQDVGRRLPIAAFPSRATRRMKSNWLSLPPRFWAEGFCWWRSQ
jgi:L-iditol 2-dehydrogenase